MKSIAKFPFIAILHYDVTCDEIQGALTPAEVISFPTVLINTATSAIVAEFHEYVKPHINPILTPYCTTLTGIQQHNVSSAGLFPSVLKRHQAWLMDFGLEQSSVLFVISGDRDLNDFLPQQCTLSDIDVPFLYRRWCNLEIFDPKGAHADMSLILSGLGPPQNHLSRGLNECRNMAEVCRALIKNGRVLT